jgi:NADPH-dependent curcumin reductase CurA
MTMAAVRNRVVRFARPVHGQLTTDHFDEVESDVVAPADGQVLVENVWLSLDPYQRRQMMPGVRYARPLHVGDVMSGRTIGRVVESRSPDIAPGDWVRGALGWQTWATVAAGEVERIELDGFSSSAYLGVLGSPGLTAWVGVRIVAGLRPAETLVVSAATGAVGSVVVALGRATGATVVGIAGGPVKCADAVARLGCNACVDHRSPTFDADLLAATPAGVDVDFENVGGPVFDAVLGRLNDFARVALCGMVSQYNLEEPYGMRRVAELLNKNATLQGFRVANYQMHRNDAEREIKLLVRSGVLAVDESIVDGLEKAPAAFVDLLGGGNAGKQLVRLVGDAP